MSTKVKKYFIHTSYRGRFFDLTICGTSRKEVVGRLQDLGVFITVSRLSQFGSFVNASESDDTSAIMVKPCGSNSVELLGKDRIPLVQAIYLIDRHAYKANQELRERFTVKK